MSCSGDIFQLVCVCCGQLTISQKLVGQSWPNCSICRGRRPETYPSIPRDLNLGAKSVKLVIFLFKKSSSLLLCIWKTKWVMHRSRRIYFNIRSTIQVLITIKLQPRDGIMKLKISGPLFKEMEQVKISKWDENVKVAQEDRWWSSESSKILFLLKLSCWSLNSWNIDQYNLWT